MKALKTPFRFPFRSSATQAATAALALVALAASGLAVAQVPVDLPAGAQVVQVSAAAAAQPPGAGEWGRVISTTPVVQQVNVPQRVCAPVVSTSRDSAGGNPAGAAVGAIAGGAIGNAIGHGNGRAAATAVGVLGGAVLGSMIGGNDSPKQITSTQCTTQTTVENRTVGFTVIYEYGGKQFQAQLPRDPGAWVQLQVAPVVQGAVAPSLPVAPVSPMAVAAPIAPIVVPSPVVVAAAPVVYAAPIVYETPYVQPVVRTGITISTPIVIGATRYVAPVQQVIYQPVVRPVVVPRNRHYVQPVSYVPAVVAPVAPVVVPEPHPVPRNVRPAVVVPEAVPQHHLHIKEGRGRHGDRQYY
jgi:uncharacterized protein YcfJ